MMEGMVIYSTSGNIMFSSTGEIINNNKVPRKHRVQKKIANKHFEDMRKFNSEYFWDNILVKFSRNIFYKEFRYIGNTLYYKIKSKNFKDELFIDPDNIEETLNNFKNFLRNKGIMPKSEVNENFSSLISEDKEQIKSWKEAGKNQIYLLYDFFNEKKEQLKLNKNEYNNLQSLLKLSIYNNILTNNDIVIEDEKIKSINYLLWDKKERKFSLDIEKIKIKPVKQDKKVNDKFYTVSSFSDDKQNLYISNEIEIVDLEKKWNTFLDSYFKIQKV